MLTKEQKAKRSELRKEIKSIRVEIQATAERADKELDEIDQIDDYHLSQSKAEELQESCQLAISFAEQKIEYLQERHDAIR